MDFRGGEPYPMANFRPPPQPQRSAFHHSVGRIGEENESPPSQNLWVGNVSEDMTEGVLMEAFAKYGEVESITLYTHRNYAFVYFKYMEHARAAKEALNGLAFGATTLQIEFARPAKPSKHLWVGGLSQNITKEQMEAEFLKFGNVEEFKFLRDRSCAIVDYSNLEDATSAVKTLNGKQLGGDSLRVDFLRSQPVKRESMINSHLNRVEVRDGHANNQRTFMGSTDLLRSNHETIIYPPDPFQGILTNVQTAHGLEGGRLEGVPSKVLWIGFPPLFKVDEQRLHNALILFGEIEWIKIVPSKHYAFVEFRSVEEARHAKDGLQGRLFNDPRIQIFFTNCEYGSVDNDKVALMTTLKGPFPPETPYRTGSHVGPIERLGFVAETDPINTRGRNMSLRSVGPQGYPEQQAPELRIPFSRIEPVHSFSDINKPAPFIATDLRPLRPSQSSWDGFDASALQRESKRPRVSEPFPVLGLWDTRKKDDEAGGSLSGYYEPQLKKTIPECTNASNGREIFGFVDKQGAHVDSSNQSVVGPGYLTPPLVSARGMNSGHWGQQQYKVMEDDFCWQGTIAKGGTPVCRTRCISVGKGIDAKFPEVINCSARTDLDTLAKHFSQASDYGLVYFLPGGDQDVHPYQEFLHYLGSKHRAGVSKFSNGTTIFLVPPSDFSEQILKVQDTDRLFGIVLKFLQQPVSAMYQNASNQTPHDPSQQYQQRHLCDVLEGDHPQVPLTTQFNTHMSRLFSPKKTLHTIQSTTKKCASQMSSLQTQAPTVPLTPNLIATLSSIVPNVLQASGPGPVSPVPSFSSRQDLYGSTGVCVSSSTVNGQGAEPEPLRQHQRPPPLPLKHPRQEHDTYRDQLQHYNQSTYSIVVTASMPSFNKTLEESEQLNSSFHQSSIMHQTTANEIVHLPSILVQSRDALGQVTSSHAQDHYQEVASANSHKSNGRMLTTESSANIQPSISSQVNCVSSRLPDQYHGGTPQALPNVQLGSNEMKSEVSSQVQQLQGLGAALLGQRQEDSESEAEKNQRYQQTLQFAASLLLQLQQNQSGNKSVTGSAQHPQ